MRCIFEWLDSFMKVDDNIYLKSIVSTGGWFHSKIRTTLKNLLIGVGKMITTNQRIILKRNQEMNNLFSYFMMNQATPHLGALSGLINHESDNHCRQPRIGTTLIFEWKASTWISQYIRKTRKLWIANKDTLWRWSIEQGGPIFQTKVWMHACHLTLKNCTYIFDLLQRKS